MKSRMNLNLCGVKSKVGHAISREASLWKVLSIKSTNLSLTRLWGKIVYNVEKSYVEKLDARKPRDFSFFNLR